MTKESTQQKYDRIRHTVQNLVLTAYPNPDQVRCPGAVAVMEYAKRAAACEERLKDGSGANARRTANDK